MSFWTLILGHAALALLLAALASRIRSGRVDLRQGALELGASLTLPVFGGAAVLTSLLLETVFRRRARPVRAEELRPAGAADGPPAAGAIETIRNGLDAAPLEDLLASPNEEALERGFQRLARSASPDAVRRLKEALSDPRRDVRVRVRSLLVGLEKRLQREAQAEPDPRARSRARGLLALLAADAAGARQHLERAVDDLRASLARRFDTDVAVDLSEVLLELGRAGESRAAADAVLRVRPGDRRGRLARLEASFRIGDREALRRDAEELARLDSPGEGEGR